MLKAPMTAKRRKRLFFDRGRMTNSHPKRHNAAWQPTAGMRRVEMWRGDFRREHICFRLFRLAVP